MKCNNGIEIKSYNDKSLLLKITNKNLSKKKLITKINKKLIENFSEIIFYFMNF